MALQNTDLFVVDRGGTNYKMAADQVTAKTGATGASIVPPGTTAERPTGVPGLLRWNNQLGYLEVYTGAVNQWNQLDYVPLPSTPPADLTITTNTTLSDGLYFVNNLTVNAGVTVTSGSCSLIFICTGNAVINGSFACPPLVSGGFPVSSTNDGFNDGSPGGNIGSGGFVYSPSVSLVGSGGISGSAYSQGANSTITSGAGGQGGANLAIRAYGAISIGAGSSIRCNGGNGGAAVNGIGVWGATGSGGGSGGSVILHSSGNLTLAAGSSIEVKGGNGTNAIQSGTASIGGGCGGGGGWVILQCEESLTNNATITLTGGTAGTSGGTPAPVYLYGGAPGGSYGGVSSRSANGSGAAGQPGRIANTGSPF